MTCASISVNRGLASMNSFTFSWGSWNKREKSQKSNWYDHDIKWWACAWYACDTHILCMWYSCGKHVIPMWYACYTHEKGIPPYRVLKVAEFIQHATEIYFEVAEDGIRLAKTLMTFEFFWLTIFPIPPLTKDQAIQKATTSIQSPEKILNYFNN